MFLVNFSHAIDIYMTTFRGVAQLAERVIWDHEAVGSRPATSTIIYIF